MRRLNPNFCKWFAPPPVDPRSQDADTWREGLTEAEQKETIKRLEAERRAEQKAAVYNQYFAARPGLQFRKPKGR